MAFGLQVFSASGQTLLEVVDHLPRVWSTHTINVTIPGATSGFVAVTGMVRDGSWLAVVGNTGGAQYAVNVWCVSGGFNWSSADANAFFSFSFPVTVFKL